MEYAEKKYPNASFANSSGNFSMTEKEDMSVSNSVNVGSPLGFEERTLLAIVVFLTQL